MAFPCIPRLGQTMYLPRIDCSFPVSDGALSFCPACTVVFLLVWVLDGPQIAPSGPSLRAQTLYFSWFPLASSQMRFHLFAPQLFWPRVVGLPPFLPYAPTFSLPFLQPLGFGQTPSSRICEVSHAAVRSSIPNRTNWILV